MVVKRTASRMGARHSTTGSPNDAADSRTNGGVEVDRTARQSLPRPTADGANAAEPGTSGPASTPAFRGSGRAGAKHKGPRTSSSSGHRRLPLDVLAASGLSARTGTSASYRTPSSNDSTPEDSPLSRTLLTSSSFPLHIFAIRDIKCPVCHKMIPADDVECHLVMCLTKPRITYNEDVLSEDKEECVICLEELRQGDTIARLPCLCIYHKSCIDQWFRVNRTCPEHPDG